LAVRGTVIIEASGCSVEESLESLVHAIDQSLKLEEHGVVSIAPSFENMSEVVWAEARAFRFA
jgi:hypothetical protein